MLTFVVSSVVAGRVAERARREKRDAEQRREDVEKLYQLSQEMMLYEDAAGLIRDFPGFMERILELNSVALYVREREQLVSSAELSALFKATLHELATEIPQMGDRPAERSQPQAKKDRADLPGIAGGRDFRSLVHAQADQPIEPPSLFHCATS